ncbi:MAG: diacylglycerol kinase family protein [Coriobacteriia bacterium]|nr:diacylglycerol kinase family protein [Coriobacteriia bacterium]
MKALLVNNLKAGQGDARLFDYIRELNVRGVEVTLRSIGGDRTLEHGLRDAEDYDRVVTAGGDGTASAAAYLLRNTGVPLLPYPAGTANLLAMNLGIPLEPARCADATLNGRTVRVDLGELSYENAGRPPGGNERRRIARPGVATRMGFAMMAGAGFDANIMHGAERLKDQIGAGAYLIAAVQNLEPQMATITLDLDGKTVETEGSAVLLLNFARIQFDLSIAHESDPTDGRFEVVVIKAKHMTELLPVLMAAFLDRIVTFPDRTQWLDTYSAKRVEIRSEPALPLQSDGDALGGVTPLSGRVLPKAATFVIPENAPIPGQIP